MPRESLGVPSPGSLRRGVPAVRLGLALLLAAATAGAGSLRAQEQPDRLALQAACAPDGAFELRIWTDFPAGATARVSLGFEGDLVPGAEATVPLLPRQVTRAALGPFPGRSVLRGEYLILARVEVQAQDATVAARMAAERGTFRASVRVRVGTPAEAEEDRRQVGAYLADLGRQCRERRRILSAGYADLLARRRFVRPGNGACTPDERAWREFVEEQLSWVGWAGEEHQRALARSVGAYYPRLAVGAAPGLIGDLGDIARRYGNLGLRFCGEETTPEDELGVPEALEHAAQDARFDRAAITLLRTVGALPPPRLERLLLSGEFLPEGMTLAAVPASLQACFATNPCRVAAAILRELGEAARACPDLDLAPAREVAWMGVALRDAPARAASIWVVAYGCAEEAAAAEQVLADKLGATLTDTLLRDEHLLIRIQSTPGLTAPERARLEQWCRARLAE